MNNVVAERSATAGVQIKPGPSRQNTHANSKSKSASQAQADLQTKLLIFESEVRGIKDERELYVHLCNTSRRVIPFRQCFYGKVSKSNAFTLLASSSISIVDRNVPFSRWIEKIASRLLRDEDATQQVRFTLPAHCDDTDDEASTYPFVEFLWTPQIHNDQLLGGALMARESEWSDSDCALVSRLSDLYLHAESSIKGQKLLTRTTSVTRPIMLSCFVVAAMLGFLPVPITALAPVEVLPKQPFVLAAPFDGVVKEITATQGEELNTGDTVIVFDDVHLLNEKKLADQRAAIADARYQRASQGAIADHRVKREIEVARAEYELAQAESRYASELLDQARLKSPVPGIAIFSNRNDWEGKPVSAGEAIVSVADPSSVELAIDLPVKESILLSQGARIKIFLDSDPLNPLDAELTEASYSAQPDKRDILSYTLTAELTDPNQTLPRIGVQGTAQVFGEKASLAYVIFRRPITAFRQYTGW